MNINEELKQSAFKSEHHKAMINIFFTNNYLIDKTADFYKKFDITRQQYNVLRILRGQHPAPATINLIKERMLDKMSDASRIVERLRIKGLVERIQSESDRRAVSVSIAASGLELLSETDPHIQEFPRLLENLSEDEVVKLNKLLDKIRS